MQLRNNHIESVGTRLKHSLVEPAVLHVRHSLVEPVLRFKHSFSEPVATVRQPKHSLVEPANLVKLQKSYYPEPLALQLRGIDVTVGSNTSTQEMFDTTGLRRYILRSSDKAATPKPTETQAREKSIKATKCWWNQSKQNNVEAAEPGISGHPSETKKSNSYPSRCTAKSASQAKETNAAAWWNWHKNSPVTVTSRGQSSKSSAWCQPMNTRNVRSYGVRHGYRRFATLIKNYSARKESVGPIQTARKIIRKEGFFSLYKGLSAVYLGIIPKMAIRFVSFEQYKDTIRRSTQLGDKSTNFVAGLSSGLTEAILIVTPAEVCKIRMQSQRHSLLDPAQANNRKYGNVLQTAITIVREEGSSALYKGVIPTMLRQGCNQGVNFTVYNAMKKYWFERKKQEHSQHGGKSLEQLDQLPGTMSMLIGGLSGAMGPMVNNPLDVVKTRLQKQTTKKNARSAPKYSGLIQACFRIAKEEGAAALWKGITPRLMRIVPGQAITFTTYEAVCRWL